MAPPLLGGRLRLDVRHRIVDDLAERPRGVDHEPRLELRSRDAGKAIQGSGARVAAIPALRAYVSRRAQLVGISRTRTRSECEAIRSRIGDLQPALLDRRGASTPDCRG